MRDQRKSIYAAALELWRTEYNSEIGRKPNAISFGLSNGEAAEVEIKGYDTSVLPTIRKPNLSKEKES